MYKSIPTDKYKKLYDDLPEYVQTLTIETYSKWLHDPLYPSLHFKKIRGNRFSIRIGLYYRAMCCLIDDTCYWDWIGTHEEYNNIVKRLISSVFSLALTAKSVPLELKMIERKELIEELRAHTFIKSPRFPPYAP